MFISKNEKIYIERSITDLFATVEKLKTEVIYLTAKVKVLENIDKEKIEEKIKQRREKQRDYMRRYKAKKRLEKQNATSISTTSI